MKKSRIAIDEVLHQPTRLKIVIFLARNGGSATASQVRAATGISRFSSLCSHASVLQTVGYITASKHFDGPTPRTTFTLTPSGRSAFQRYRAALGEIIMEEAA